VVPFEHSSGISIKGKSRVHKMANKELKRLLFLCANSAVLYYPEFKDYYNRRMEEGKDYLTVINAIKNKILLRVVSVVNNQKKYETRYPQAA
jgi:transposase